MVEEVAVVAVVMGVAEEVGLVLEAEVAERHHLRQSAQVEKCQMVLEQAGLEVEPRVAPAAEVRPL